MGASLRHKMKLSTIAAAFVGVQGINSVEQAGLDQHNTYRKTHCAPQMQWDNSLCADAQRWADHLAENEIFQHDPNLGNVGENLFFSYSSRGCEPNYKYATDVWYAEVEDYTDYNQGADLIMQGDPPVGHFTQVVWTDSTKLCMAVAKNSDGNKCYIVARYFQRGNYVNSNQHVAEHVLPPNC